MTGGVCMLAFFMQCLQSVTLLLSYVANGNAFPKPLSAAEERECLKRFAQGDMEARNTLIEHNLRLVAHIAKKYLGCGQEQEELLSVGTIGLIKGITSFNPEKGTRLATYAARCVDNEILMLLRAKKKEQGDVSLNESIGTDKEGNQIMLMDVLAGDNEDIFDEIHTGIEVRKLYRNLKNELDEREQEVVILRYGLLDGNCIPQREIAKRLKISRSYVSRIEKKAVQKLRKGIVE
ncbi:MAG: RNA polymerase sporulation sigma factor SigK [Clostridia bacterium]|nr:RNA polymerase sporulation sigma factor SigK [Clostridia bacterium]